MKKIILSLIVLALVYSACKKDEVTTPVVTTVVPTLQPTPTVTAKTQNTASCGGTVLSNGGAEITVKGVCWSTSENPTVSNNKTSDGSGSTSYSSILTGLTANNTKYYVRSYATNSVGTGYGTQVEFYTISENTKIPPTVTTTDISVITSSSATSGGNVINAGGLVVTARGVCWSLSAEPTIADNITSDEDGTGEFSSIISGLTAKTTYFFRAYATNSKGTSYGEEKTFTTLDANAKTIPTIKTDPILTITENSATSGGNIINNGGSDITARGICWSINQNPTTSDNKTSDGNGTGTFVSNISGLTKGTIYYVRAYATNSTGTAYGEEKSFKTTIIPTLPTVTTSNITSITQTTAICGGNVTDDGGTSVTSRGICLSTSPEPTNKSPNGSGLGTFTSSISGLTAGTTYYVRAYATNSLGTTYGTEVSFKTENAGVTIPTVITSTVSSITQTSAYCGVTITSGGGGTISGSGVCWSTSTNPTTANNKSTGGSGSITGLTGNTKYYVRAYATNEVGTAYGAETSFTTFASVTTPTISTAAVSAITKTTATSGVSVTSTGGATVTASGVCWSTTSNPTTSNSKTTGGSGNITGLTGNTTYYVRAYATNSAGTAYGNQESFTTLDAPTLTTSAVFAITQTSAGSGVVVSNDGGATVSASGVCWSTTSNPTTASSKTTGGSGNITGLTANTKYYIRAYATNSVGTAYGNELNFTTDPNVVAGPELLITEFQAIGSFEFIEIYNNTATELKLSDFSLAEIDIATGLPTKSVVRISTTSKNITIKSGEYKIIVPDISGNKNLTDFMNTYSLTSADTLGIIKLASITKTDGGDDIVIIKYGTQTIVDKLGWNTNKAGTPLDGEIPLKTFYGGTVGVKENSAERNKLTGSSTDGANWNKSLVVGTPGKKNSVM